MLLFFANNFKFCAVKKECNNNVGTTTTSTATNNNFAVILKYLGWRPAGNSHVSWAGKVLFSLGW